jgi:hypothetical protein
MTREEKWMAFVRALQALTASSRPLRICLDCCFADESDFGALPALFPHVEKIGLIVPDLHAAAIYRRTLKSLGWAKVEPVVEGDQFSNDYNIIVNRW